MARYELRDGTSDEVLSRHLTESGAMDTWRLRYAHHPVRIVRTRSGGVEMPVVEGVWHRARRRSQENSASEGQTEDGQDADGHRRTLRELLDVIVDTSVSDWHLLPRVDPPTPGTTFIGGSRPGEVRPAAHEVVQRLAVLREDPGTALAWDFQPEPGRGAAVPSLAGSLAASRTVEIRLHGSVVHRTTYLDVDRGTVYLPTPVREEPAGTFTIRAWDNKLLSLLNEMAGLGEYTAFCSRLGLLEVPGHPLDDQSV